MVPHQVLSYEDPREECVNEVSNGGGMHTTMVSHQVPSYEDPCTGAQQPSNVCTGAQQPQNACLRV